MAKAFSGIRFLSLTLVFSLIFGVSAYATDGHEDHGDVTTVETTSTEHTAEGTEPVEHEDEWQSGPWIIHHLGDAHEWHYYGEGHDAIAFPLPIILYSKEGGLDVFMSSAFHHDDHGTVLAKGKYLKMHEKIYLANAEGKLDLNEHGHPENAMPLDLSITKNVAAMLFASFLLILIMVSTARGYTANGVPTGIGKFMEPLVLFVRDEIAVPNIGEKKANKYLGYLLTVFFFIWTINMLGLFPMGPNMSGNIAFTFTLAIVTFLITNVSGSADYWKHILWPPVPLPMKPLMIIVEVIGIFTKPFALMIRLFANITAGHALMYGLVSIIFLMQTAKMGAVSVPFMLFMTMLELLVAALQAYIFTLLSALFIGLAVSEHEEHDHGVEESTIV